jgi:hypothetical protein
MESAAVEELRSRIAKEIGRDSVLITSDDKERHFDGASFVAFYGGGLFLAFVAAAGNRLWEKIKQQGGKAGVRVVDTVWDAVAKKLSGAAAAAEHDSDAQQVERIKDANIGLQQLGTKLENSYVADFLDAGRNAVETRLRRDHFSEAKAKRIADAIAIEVKQHIASGQV